MKKQTQKSDLDQYFQLKQNLELPVKLKLYLSIFQSAIDQGKAPRTIESRKGFSKALLNAFLNLSIQEKGFYLLDSIKFIRGQLEKNLTQKTKSDSRIEVDGIVNIETSCEMNFLVMKISYWSTVSFKLDKSKKQIQITNKKKNMVIDLRLYYVRKSKKYKYSIVLQAVNEQINNEAKKYIFCFQSSVVNRIYEEILKCVLLSKNQKIVKMLYEEEDQDKQSKASGSNNKGLVFLSSKNVNDYLNYKESVFKKLITTKFDFKLIHSQADLKIEQSYKIDKVFKLENVIDLPVKKIKEEFLSAFMKRNKYLVHSQILEDFSKKYRAVYEKYMIKGKIHELISIKEENLTEHEDILFMKSLQNIMTKNYLQFLLVKVRPVNAFKSKLVIVCSINLSPLITNIVVKAFLVQLNDMIFREEIQMVKKSSTDTENQYQNDEDEFQTVKGDSEEMVEFVQGEDQQSKSQEFKNIKYEEQLDKKIVKTNYLLANHSMEPFEEKEGKVLMTQHYLFSDWVRIKTGGVVCINEAIVAEQKRLFKYFLTKMGTNLLKGGNILRISIPVHVFKKQSHLESIGKDFCFAPMFFEKCKNDVIERIKYATLLAISVGTLGISMEKPFNPILGQTIQLWIDGCPFYAEQISHHPPIGAYYFKGRGYKIHGQIEPKINFGMNNVKGFSERPNYLKFDDGSELQMVYGKMLIKGMLFGEREFNFTQKIFVYDKTNHYFSEIIYGPKKKKMLHKSNEANDFIYGKIYQLKPQFLQKFKASHPKVFPTKQYILKQISEFEGIWNESIKFDGVQYCNFKTDLPCRLDYEQFPLPSDSNYRTDLLKLRQGSVEQAQAQKQRLEDIQRRQRNLREKFKKK